MTTEQTLMSSTPGLIRARAGIGAADDAIIRAVARLDYLTAEQLCRRLYSAGSLTYVRARVARLTQSGYLHRSGVPKATPAGSTPRVYTLGPRGRAYLADHGEVVADRLRLAEVDGMSSIHLQHALGVTDVLIACELLCQERPEYRIERLLTDRALKRAHMRVSLPGAPSRQSSVAPDAWVDFRRHLPDGNALQRCLTFEYDNNSEHQSAFRAKLRRLLAWAHGPYSAYFGTRSLAIAVVTSGGHVRRANLVRWTERELEQQHDMAAARYFYLTEQIPAATGPSLFFTGAGGWQPFAEAPVALLTAAG